MENGSHGGSTAGPIARKVIDYYLLGKLPVVEPPKDAKVVPSATGGAAANPNLPIENAPEEELHHD